MKLLLVVDSFWQQEDVVSKSVRTYYLEADSSGNHEWLVNETVVAKTQRARRAVMISRIRILHREK